MWLFLFGTFLGEKITTMKSNINTWSFFTDNLLFKFGFKPWKMKRLLFSFFASFALCLMGTINTQAQVVTDNTSAGLGRTGSLTTLGGHLRLKSIETSTPELSIEMLKKKYLTFSYELVTVDDSDLKGHLRYNIYDDEMEFVRENNLYYLVKEIGRKVYFEDIKSTYKLLRFNQELHYFKVLAEGNYMLLAKHRVRYFEARPAESGYDKAKPAKYKRLKDELYLATGHKIVTKITGIKKADFINFFGGRSSEMETFMKRNKLSYKKVKDLQKIIGYYNTL